MSETSLIMQIAILLALVLGFLLYMYISRRKILKNRSIENRSIESYARSSGFSAKISTVIEEKVQEKLDQRIIKANNILDSVDEDMTYAIPIASDIQLIETDICLLITGPVESIASICDEFAAMERLPQGYCAQLGD